MEIGKNIADLASGKSLSPEKLFRVITLLCLVGTGGSIIFVASNVGSQSVSFGRTHDLIVYFFSALCMFVFFYAQYRLVPRFIPGGLDDLLGYWQSWGGLALLLAGALCTVHPVGAVDLPGNMLTAIALLGEAVFIANVVFSWLHAPAAGRRVTSGAARRTAESSIKNFGWPKSPVTLFGIGAGALAAGGFVSLILNMPSFKVPVPWAGQMHFLPMGCLWLAAAAPFAVFALLYKLLITSYGLVFDDSLTRAHFAVIIVAALNVIRTFASWQEALVSPSAALYFDPQTEWMAALFGLGTIVFAINTYRSFRHIASGRSPAARTRRRGA